MQSLESRNISPKLKNTLYIILVIVTIGIIVFIIYAIYKIFKIIPKSQGSLYGTSFQSLNYPYVAAVNEEGDLMRINAAELMVPTGTIMMWSTSEVPSGWLECNGQSCSQFTELTNLLKSNNVPDLRGNVPVGHNTSDSTFNTLLANNGSKDVTLSTSNLPSHNHSIVFSSNTDDALWTDAEYKYFRVPNKTAYMNLVANKESKSTDVTVMDVDGKSDAFRVGIKDVTGNTGDNKSVSILQPSVTLKFIIKT